MQTPNKQSPASGPGFAKSQAAGRGLHADYSAGGPLALLLSRLEGVQKSGRGWRSICPVCGGKSRKVSITEADNAAVLLHAFCGHSPAEVLAAVGLRLHDLFPERLRPSTPEERRAAQRAFKESAWRTSLGTLDTEATVVQAAARMVQAGTVLSVEDDARLQLALDRISSARAVLK